MNSDSSNLAPEPRHAIGVGVVVLRNGPKGVEVLLIRRGKAPGKGEWSIPGGRQERCETVRQAAVREIAEETGLILENLILVDVVDRFGKGVPEDDNIHWTLIDFCAWSDGGDAQAGSDAVEVRWVPLSELKGYNLWDETLRVVETAAKTTAPVTKELQ